MPDVLGYNPLSSLNSIETILSEKVETVRNYSIFNKERETTTFLHEC